MSFALAGVAVMLGEIEGLDFGAVVQELGVAHAVAQARQVQILERPGEDVKIEPIRLRVIRVAAVRWR